MSDTYRIFFETLVDCKLLVSLHEAQILANVHGTRRSPDYQAVFDVCATRAAHKTNRK